MKKIDLLILTLAIGSCSFGSIAQAQDLNQAPTGYDGSPDLRGPMPGQQGGYAPNAYAQPGGYPDGAGQPPAPFSGQPTRIGRTHGGGLVGDAVGAPGKAVKTSVGATDTAAKAGVGVTGKTAKVGVGATDRAAKTAVGVPLKAVKETFKAIF